MSTLTRSRTKTIISTMGKVGNVDVQGGLEEHRAHGLQVGGGCPEPPWHWSGGGSGSKVSKSKRLLEDLKSFSRYFLSISKGWITSGQLTLLVSLLSLALLPRVGACWTFTAGVAERIIVEDVVEVTKSEPRTFVVIVRWHVHIIKVDAKLKVVFLGPSRLVVVEGSLHRRLSSGRGWKDEDVGGGGILGGGQGASCRVPSEPLVWRELLVHHAQHRVRFH